MIQRLEVKKGFWSSLDGAVCGKEIMFIQRQYFLT